MNLEDRIDSLCVDANSHGIFLGFLLQELYQRPHLRLLLIHR